MSFARHEMKERNLVVALRRRGLSLPAVRRELQRSGYAHPPSNQTIKRWSDERYAKLIRTRVLLESRVSQKGYRARKKAAKDEHL